MVNTRSSGAGPSKKPIPSRPSTAKTTEAAKAPANPVSVPIAEEGRTWSTSADTERDAPGTASQLPTNQVSREHVPPAQLLEQLDPAMLAAVRAIVDERVAEERANHYVASPNQGVMYSQRHQRAEKGHREEDVAERVDTSNPLDYNFQKTYTPMSPFIPRQAKIVGAAPPNRYPLAAYAAPSSPYSFSILAEPPDRRNRYEGSIPTIRSRSTINNQTRNEISLNAPRALILYEIQRRGLADLPPLREGPMGPDLRAVCHYHRASGHDTEDCRSLKYLVERLVGLGQLGSFIQGNNPREANDNRRNRLLVRGDDRSRGRNEKRQVRSRGPRLQQRGRYNEQRGDEQRRETSGSSKFNNCVAFSSFTFK